MKTVVIFICSFLITDPTSVKVTTYEMNTKLGSLKLRCFIDIHIIKKNVHGCLETRILSPRADGLLQEKIRAAMYNNIFYISIAFLIY